MATELKVPALGMDMEEAVIVRWLVEEGQEVRRGDPVLEIETDKTSFELEAPEDGEIRSLRGEEGEALPVGAVLAYITAPGEQAPEPAPAPTPAVPPRVEPAPAAPPASLESGGNGAGVRASPAARRAAAERGIRLEEISGSGPRGRVYLSDVLRAGELAVPVPDGAGAAPEVRRERLSRIRRLGAERTARSFAEVPHFYLTRDLDVDRALELLERLRELAEPAPTLTDLFAFFVSRVLPEHPRLNARYAGEELELFPQVNLGVAVATDEGLVVPVLRRADSLSLQQTAPAVRELVERARSGRLRPEDLSGGTFTISNLGMMGIDHFDPVINAPEAAILAVGRVRTVPAWREDSWVPGRVVSVTLAVDHRAADGADGARFLESLQRTLNGWELLL